MSFWWRHTYSAGDIQSHMASRQTNWSLKSQGQYVGWWAETRTVTMTLVTLYHTFILHFTSHIIRCCYLHPHTHSALHIVPDCGHSRRSYRGSFGAFTTSNYLIQTLNAFVSGATLASRLLPGSGGILRRMLGACLCLLLSGLCGKAVCFGYMCLALCVLTFYQNSVWTCDVSSGLYTYIFHSASV